MIPTKEKVEVTSNLPGEEVIASIGDPRMVMKSLTKLYSNTALATIREYSTNARDANVEAGRRDIPIEVSLPTILDPYFVVKDTGIGLSTEELKQVYVSYGTSTKRESNDFNGMLGFGSKSALAYTNSFTVVAVKDGVKTTAVITRNEDYSVVLKIVATTKTNEHNGVTVKVPVQQPESFRRIAMDFYRFWMPGTILVDGEEPVQAVGEKLKDNLYYSLEADRSYVVMGNVGYRVENPDVLFKKTKPIPFVAYVENGSVEFTPSREDLEYSNSTKETLYQVIGDFEQEIYELGKKEIESKTDPFEAYSTWLEWSDRAGNLFNEVEFNGETFKKTIGFTTGYKYNPYTYRRYNVDTISKHWFSLDVKTVNNNLLITGYEAEKVHSAHKTKVKEYLELKQIKSSVVYLIPDDCDNQWVNPERVVDWEDLKAALPKKAPRKRNPSVSTGRIPGSFDYWDEDGKFHIGKELPEKASVFWVAVSYTNNNNTFSAANIIKYLKHKKVKGAKDICIVRLAANREEKFKRDNPQTKNIIDFATPHINLDGKSLLSDDAKTAMNLDVNGWSNVIKFFAKTNVLDKEFDRHSKLLAKKDELVLEYNLAFNFAVAMGKRWEFKRYDVPGTRPGFLDTYPLLLALYKNSYNFPYNLKDELVTYMNDTYKRKVKTSV